MTTPKPLSMWITTNWKILQETRIPDHLTFLLRNLYAGQEATVRTGHGTINWFQIGKGECQDRQSTLCEMPGWMKHKLESRLLGEISITSDMQMTPPCGRCIMGNAGWEEAQAGIKIPRRNINNLRYADATALMAEREEELKSLLMKVKEESEKVGLKFSIQKTKIMASSPITSWQIDGETVRDFIFGGSKITADGLQP